MILRYASQRVDFQCASFCQERHTSNVVQRRYVEIGWRNWLTQMSIFDKWHNLCVHRLIEDPYQPQQRYSYNVCEDVEPLRLRVSTGNHVHQKLLCLSLVGRWMQTYGVHSSRSPSELGQNADEYIFRRPGHSKNQIKRRYKSVLHDATRWGRL